MLPILLIHGYASEGSGNSAADIYGSLPADLRESFGEGKLEELDLSRWISLSDGIDLDDVSYAMDRALRKRLPHLLQSGFNVVIHSTGALVVRNWIRLFSPKPCPIQNLVHLAGANFGSGLAHIGRGQASRWGRQIFLRTTSGIRVLDELEFGAWKTIDLHRYFLQKGQGMLEDYHVQEFCLIGSQTLKGLRHVPIRYLKEDSSDNTVRTSAGNLNFNYIEVTPKAETKELSIAALRSLLVDRGEDKVLSFEPYEYDLDGLAEKRTRVPFSVVFETAHFGDEIGIVSGSKNRKQIMPLIKQALMTDHDSGAYAQTAEVFEQGRAKTFESAKGLSGSLLGWNKQSQYEGHAQLIFRLRDQFGKGVVDFDVTFNSSAGTSRKKFEHMIEDKHVNRKDHGTITFYLRMQEYDKKAEVWKERMDNMSSVRIEITAHEEDSKDIIYVPLSLKFTASRLRRVLQSFRTTIIDVTMLRLPGEKVFKVTSAS